MLQWEKCHETISITTKIRYVPLSNDPVEHHLWYKLIIYHLSQNFFPISYNKSKANATNDTYNTKESYNMIINVCYQISKLTSSPTVMFSHIFLGPKLWRLQIHKHTIFVWDNIFKKTFSYVFGWTYSIHRL